LSIALATGQQILSGCHSIAALLHHITLRDDG
jgi:cytochrome b561